MNSCVNQTYVHALIYPTFYNNTAPRKCLTGRQWSAIADSKSTNCTCYYGRTHHTKTLVAHPLSQMIGVDTERSLTVSRKGMRLKSEELLHLTHFLPLGNHAMFVPINKTSKIMTATLNSNVSRYFSRGATLSK